MDDRDGVFVARSKGSGVAGTLGILAMAANLKVLARYCVLISDDNNPDDWRNRTAVPF